MLSYDVDWSIWFVIEGRYRRMNKKIIILYIIFVVSLMIGAGYTMTLLGCGIYAMDNAETMIVDISESDILWDEQDFYIIDPDGNRIPLGIDGNEVLDLTKHSRVLVKFKRYPAYGLYGGCDWFVDGIVKTPNP